MMYILEVFYCLLYVTGITIIILKFDENQSKYKKSWIILCVVNYTVVNYFLTDINIYFNFDFIIRNLLVIIFDFIFACILLKKIKGTNLVVSILYFLLYGCCLLLYVNFFTQVLNFKILDLTSPGILKTEVVIIVICTTTLIMYLLSSFISAIKIDMKIRETFPFIILNGFNIFIIMLFLIDFKINSLQILLFVFLLIIFQTIILNIMFIKTIRKYNKESEEKLIDLSNQYSLKLMEDLKREQESYHELKHDIENHLLVLESFADTESIKSYVNEIKSDIIVDESKIETGNLLVDACLNSKISTYEDVQISVDAILSNNIVLCDKDISSLLFNLLDNAVNASKESAQKKVELKMLQDEYSLSIRCRNSCDNEPDFKSSKGKSHGYGLKIIDHIIAKYKGEIVKEYKNKEFCVSIYFLF